MRYEILITLKRGLRSARVWG